MRKWRRPSVFAVVLTLSGALAFSALGVWQLRRAQEKERLLAAFASAAQAPLADFAEVRDSVEATRYPHVRVAGEFVAGRGYLLDEQMREGRAGVHVLGVFAAAGAEHLLLVDRGWVAWNHAQGTSPDAPPLPAGAVTLTGIYAPYPGGGLRIGNALPNQAAWPKLTLYLDRAEIGADLGKELAPRMLLLDAAVDSGFVREWTPQVMPPQRHIAYAVQWFALALAAVAIFVVRHWRKVDGERDG